MPEMFDFDSIPLLQLLLLTIAFFLFSMWAGIVYGRRFAKGKKEPEKGFGVIVGGQLTLVAFVIAFVFGMASSRFDMKRSNLLEETNSIGTTYLRTDLLADPVRSELKILLKEYVDLRVDVHFHPETLQEVLKRSDEILDKLWKTSSAYAVSQPSSEIVALYIQSLNETIDLHTKRVTVSIVQKIPPAIWLSAYILAIICMFVIGFESGISNAKLSIPGFLFALTFALVITLISDLDRSAEGMFKVNHQPMIELQSKINSEVR
jgi:protein-S-isoprenylcysteine O-methyltransferase Ste14